MIYDLIGFGKHIKKLREDIGIKQLDVYEIVKINRDTLRKLESGKSFPKIETLDLLSLVYRRDMNHEFSKFKITYDDYLETRLQKVMPQLKSLNYEDIEKEKDFFYNYFNESNITNYEYLNNKIDQFITYLSALSKLEVSLKEVSREHLTKLSSALGHSYRDFVEDKEKLNLNMIEIRICILLSTIYRFRNEFENSIVYLDAASHALKTKYQTHEKFLYFYFIINYNLMTFHLRLTNHEEVDKIYTETLKTIDTHLSINTLSSIFIRGGINKHYLSKDDRSHYINFGLNILVDVGYEKKAKRYYDNFTKLYPFINFNPTLTSLLES